MKKEKKEQLKKKVDPNSEERSKFTFKLKFNL